MFLHFNRAVLIRHLLCAEGDVVNFLALSLGEPTL